MFANELENVPFHVSIFILAFIVQNVANLSANWDSTSYYGTLALSALYVIYAGLRVIYTICYLFALQPFRTISFVLSQLVVQTTVAILLYSAFTLTTANLQA